MIKETIKEFAGKATIADLIICIGGTIVLAIWLLRTSLGKRALINSRPRRNNMPPYLALVPPIFWFLTIWLLNLIKERTLPDLAGWQDAFANNLIWCLSAAPLIVTGLFLAKIHFTRGLKGFGLNLKTIVRDLGASLLNLLAIMPVVLASIMVVALAGKFLVGPDYQMPRHEELNEILMYPQRQLRMLIMFTAIAVVPFYEELIFRGLFQTLLRSYLGRPWLAIIFASLIFIVFHANPEHWLALFGLSLCLGYSYEKSGSLFRPIFIHSLFNAMSVFAALSQ